MDDDSNTLRTAGASAISAVPRRIHPLVAMAAVSVTAVSAIAAYQFLWPQSARSETAQQSVHGFPRDSAHQASRTAAPLASAACHLSP
jgi:hypothetical protein